MTPKVKAHIERTIISEFELMEADFTMEELKAIASYNRSKQNPPNNTPRLVNTYTRVLYCYTAWYLSSIYHP